MSDQHKTTPADMVLVPREWAEEKAIVSTDNEAQCRLCGASERPWMPIPHAEGCPLHVKQS